MKKFSAKGLWEVLKKSFAGFLEDKVPKLSASLAYYTIFSLAPLLIVLIFLTSFFFGREAIEGSIYGELKGFVGADSAAQIQEVVRNASLNGKGGMAATIGVITLLIGATTVFAEIQDSINSIWGLKAKPKAGILKLLKDRLLSFGIIGSLGFLLLVSLSVTAVVEGLNERLQNVFPNVTVVLFYIINLAITLSVVTALFAVIFRVLPDAKIQFKDVWPGAIATAILFMLGKFAIALYVSKSAIGSTYGAAGSFVVLLVWIYYSSIILYFGAEFTKAYAIKYGSEIHPNHYAVVVKRVEVESESGSLQQNHAELEQHKEDIRNGVTPQLTANRQQAQPQPATGDPYKVVKVKPYGLDERDEKTVRKETKKSVGMATVVGGLLLYFINTSAKKTNRV
jgi:membrane protein